MSQCTPCIWYAGRPHAATGDDLPRLLTCAPRRWCHVLQPPEQRVQSLDETGTWSAQLGNRPKIQHSRPHNMHSDRHPPCKPCAITPFPTRRAPVPYPPGIPCVASTALAGVHRGTCYGRLTPRAYAMPLQQPALNSHKEAHPRPQPRRCTTAAIATLHMTIPVNLSTEKT